MLEELNLSGCQKLALVEGLGVLKFLKKLYISSCNSFEGLPDLSNLGMLEELNLSGCSKLAVVEGLGVLESLKRLDLSKCVSLEGLPDLLMLGNARGTKALWMPEVSCR
ncbi:hypothetical protein L1049_017415 [Liquidambar formosana]|uniref:Uncharacterized protein n=1 Tax=Liquidambar formosana TaxID=63359 RepID=A0AAP0S349_LIQFO